MSLDDKLEKNAEVVGLWVEQFFNDKKFVWETPRTIESLDSQKVRFKK